MSRAVQRAKRFVGARFVAWRRQSFARYRALPPYPNIIKGRFDPQRWGADPLRRSDYFDLMAR